MTVDNSRFSYYNPAEYLDRAALAAASTEVGAQVATQSDLEDLLPNYGVQYMPTSGGPEPRVHHPGFGPVNREQVTSQEGLPQSRQRLFALRG